MHTAQKDYKLLVLNASVCDIKHPIIGNKSMEKNIFKKRLHFASSLFAQSNLWFVLASPV